MTVKRYNVRQQPFALVKTEVPVAEAPVPSAVHDYTWKAVIAAFSATSHDEAVDIIIDLYGRRCDGDFLIDDPHGLLAFTARLGVLLPRSFSLEDFDQFLTRVRRTATHDCFPALLVHMAADRLQELVRVSATDRRGVIWALRWQQELVDGSLEVEELAQAAFLLFNFMFSRRKIAQDPQLQPAGLQQMALEIARRENALD